MLTHKTTHSPFSFLVCWMCRPMFGIWWCCLPRVGIRSVPIRMPLLWLQCSLRLVPSRRFTWPWRVLPFVFTVFTTLKLFTLKRFLWKFFRRFTFVTSTTRMSRSFSLRVWCNFLIAQSTTVFIAVLSTGTTAVVLIVFATSAAASFRQLVPLTVAIVRRWILPVTTFVVVVSSGFTLLCLLAMTIDGMLISRQRGSGSILS